MTCFMPQNLVDHLPSTVTSAFEVAMNKCYVIAGLGNSSWAARHSSSSGNVAQVTERVGYAGKERVEWVRQPSLPFKMPTPVLLCVTAGVRLKQADPTLLFNWSTQLTVSCTTARNHILGSKHKRGRSTVEDIFAITILHQKLKKDTWFVNLSEEVQLWQTLL